MNKYRTINLEEGMPTSDQAIRRLTFEINGSKRQGVVALKIIHGFGSSGTGGKIRIESRKYLRSLQNRGKISFFIEGENLSIFNESTRRALDICPDIRADRDLERHNNGITVIIL